MLSQMLTAYAKAKQFFNSLLILLDLSISSYSIIGYG